MIIYGIKTCGSVRKALKFCKDNNIECDFHDIRKDPLSDDKIKHFASKVDVNLLFNNKGTKYRDLKLKELNLDNAGKLEWLCKENMLLKRPVIEYNNDKVLCAFDEEVYKKEFL
ncbi:MAG: Spx/MgsR family RNA polymerase-binding regulatory protein [Campylobacteraceae bacterium]|jgi:Spx/MgsR family transcriptional regulator|nr:Spx/MgsR family RNA polymerase-binding regulatory protein [Campylobacteraceae bacterium]MBT3882280.1 Spx/MgsR family RNA polymerase-binding regulatory protein [Campylobacteraceae bacterium]MBT4030314.1 Spx/MgsR family RNA polymerase-binding regulatory protein [Campylobacteraceae bacterium]MBT4179166.1 Spx/MgsR family RNA polymerase-binding regulatory protein [Campylobacteraceae bacterium]MBT4572362.1 Spx/MgsR family RNA polymerase-binding regulatory protein [Campylobacteraceae bacterium]